MDKNIKIGERTYSVASDDNYLNAMGSCFEPHMVQLFRALVNRNDVVADIGANIGLTAILFSSLARKVFAFEPSPSTYNILTGNLARNGITNVDAVNVGLGEKIESLTITFEKNNRSGGYVSDKIRPETGHVTEEIRIDTLDHYFSRRESAPNFLKIDVEGFEQNVIKGAELLLQNNKPTVVMEMNHFCLDVLQRITIPEFLDFMRSVFPYLYAIDTDNVAIADLHNPDQAYFVMHEHVVGHRFPNLVGGFDQSIKAKLEGLAATSSMQRESKTPRVIKPKGSLQVNSLPASVSVGEIFEIPVVLSNEGEDGWHSYGTNPVVLSYHWQNADGSYLVYDGMRTTLERQVVSPGETVDEMCRVAAPSERGRFKLILSVVQEGVCWFEDRGFACAKGEVVIG